jgi:pantoate--beta-alanine ligase
MRVITSAIPMQRLARRWRRAGMRVGLVPTMGALHAGHLSLVAVARRHVGRRGQVVLSLFVNPTQFGPREDFARYPRDFAGDRRQCRQAGVDVLFAPSVGEMYPADPAQPFSTFVCEEHLSVGMEGRTRPTHFRGVTTVVAKLFNLVLPDIAVFGEKDFQQAAIVRRMVRDLNFPVEIVVAPTVREADGLALSSRNRYLTPSERAQATVLWEAIQWARREVTRTAWPAARLRAAVARLVASRPAAKLDYVEFFDPATLRPQRQVAPGAHMALAVWIGKTRLIDNGRL